MRYFICSFDSFNLIRFGIPAELTGKIMQLSRVQNSFCETAGSEIFISLPVLFRQKIIDPHGLVLKLTVTGDRKIILLTPKIEKEMEIPNDKVHGLPEVLSGPFVYFKGVFFSNENPVLIICPEKLMGCIS